MYYVTEKLGLINNNKNIQSNPNWVCILFDLHHKEESKPLAASGIHHKQTKTVHLQNILE